MGRALLFHEAKTALIPGNPYGSPNDMSRVISECRARHIPKNCLVSQKKKKERNFFEISSSQSNGIC